ncbi:hypothetical protein ACLOJK_037581 [Asimina triloba]
MASASNAFDATSTPTCHDLPLGMEENSPSGRRNKRRAFWFRRWKGLQVLPEMRQQRSKCLVCLQVHQIKDLPASVNGRAIVVGWRTKGWEGEETMPVHAWEGKASFDEIFLHYCNIKTPGAKKIFTIWVSLVESKECNLGTFELRLSELIMDGSTNNLNFSGKTLKLDLCGAAAGATLSVSFYSTITVDSETNVLQHLRSNSIGSKQAKNKCCFCLPIKTKNRSLASSIRGVASLEPDLGFITLIDSPSENSHRSAKDEEEDFITIEKGIMSNRSWRPPSDDSSFFEEDESHDSETKRENTSVCSEYYEESEVDQVEDEFLRMLREEKHMKTEEHNPTTSLNATVPWEKEMKGLEEGFDLQLELLLKAAEAEVRKAAQVWKSRAEGRALEKAEYEELLGKWRKDGKKEFESSSSLENFVGFGSPI